MNKKINAIYLKDKQKVIKRLRFPDLLTHHQLINSSTHQLINLSTHQLINSSTHQLINSSTHQLNNKESNTTSLAFPISS